MNILFSQSQAPVDVKTSVLLVDGKYSLVTLDYVIKEENDSQENGDTEPSVKKKKDEASGQKWVVLNHYPMPAKLRLSFN